MFFVCMLCHWFLMKHDLRKSKSYPGRWTSSRRCFFFLVCCLFCALSFGVKANTEKDKLNADYLKVSCMQDFLITLHWTDFILALKSVQQTEEMAGVIQMKQVSWFKIKIWLLCSMILSQCLKIWGYEISGGKEWCNDKGLNCCIKNLGYFF